MMLEDILACHRFAPFCNGKFTTMPLVDSGMLMAPLLFGLYTEKAHKIMRFAVLGAYT